MRRLIMSAIAVSIVAVTASAADEYDSYVWLSSSDSATSSSFFNNDNKRWVKKDHSGAFVAETQGPHAGEKYYIPGSKILTTPNATGSANSPIEYVFAGDELAVAHRLQLMHWRVSCSALPLSKQRQALHLRHHRFHPHLRLAQTRIHLHRLWLMEWKSAV